MRPTRRDEIEAKRARIAEIKRLREENRLRAESVRLFHRLLFDMYIILYIGYICLSEYVSIIDTNLFFRDTLNLQHKFRTQIDNRLMTLLTVWLADLRVLQMLHIPHIPLIIQAMVSSLRIPQETRLRCQIMI